MLVSIVIPVYNRHELLPRVLSSIYAQTDSELEIIIVDDGSVPALDVNILPRCSRYGLKLVRQDNQGAPAARNRGAREAAGEYIIFWDADITADPLMLAKMRAALSAHPEASYAYSDFYFGWKKMPAGSFSAARLREMNYIHTASLLRRGDFPGYDISLKRFQDWDLWLTLLRKQKIGVYVPGYLFRVLPHGLGISHWLPRFASRRPWRWLPPFRKKVEAYEIARQVICNKHGLNLAAPVRRTAAV